MAKQVVLKGDTSRIEYVFIQNSSVTTGAGLTGLVFNSAGLTAYYVRTQAAAAAITLATQTVTGAFSSGGFVEVDATNMPGIYRVDIPDAAFATGVDKVIVHLKGATNMAPVSLEYQLVNYNPEDGVRLGLTALPNAAAEAAGGLYTRGTGAGQINQDANGRVDTNTAAMAAGVVTAAAVATGAIDADALATDAVQEIWDRATASLTTAGSIGKLLVDNVDATVSSRATPAQVATEIADALATDTYAEPGQAAPAATATLAAKINYLYKAWRNKKTQTATTWSLFADDTTTVDQKSTVSDDGTTATRGEVATGP